MATIKVILWSILILAGVGYWRYAHAQAMPPSHIAAEPAR
jgi:hypothetical protein